MPRKSKYPIDLTGLTFGRLTVVEKDRDEYKGKQKRTYWRCRCNCGNEIVVSRNSLVTGNTTSCGCYQREVAATISSTYLYKHGMTDTPLHLIWQGMRKRCKNKGYKSYGGKGVKVCQDWEDFTNFYKWSIDNGYIEGKGLSIDRINNDGDYEPNNCRWVDDYVQANNKSTNVYITMDGETHTLKEWYRILQPDLTYETIDERYNIEGFISKEQLFNRRHYSKK